MKETDLEKLRQVQRPMLFWGVGTALVSGVIFSRGGDIGGAIFAAFSVLFFIMYFFPRNPANWYKVRRIMIVAFLLVTLAPLVLQAFFTLL